MMVELFAVLDSAAERYIEPFCGSTIAVALRGFQEACEREDHQFRKFPEDYSLWHVGSFDAELGELVPIPLHKIAMATSYTNRLTSDEVSLMEG